MPSVLTLVRYAVPLAAVLAGIVLLLVAPDSNRFEGGAGFIAAGLSIFAFNLLYRLGVRGDAERDDEERARRFFDAHGYWPDDARRVPGDERRER